MEIESDQEKADRNLVKHGVGFDEAATVLLDPMALVREDDDAKGEARFVAVGMSAGGRLLTVCYTLRRRDVIRLISARKATTNERRHYEG